MTDDKAQKRLTMLEARIEKGADDPFIFYARALELRSLDRLDDALQALTDVAQRYPDYVPTYLMAGQVAQALEHNDLARDYLQRGIALAERVGDHHALSELQQALSGL